MPATRFFFFKFMEFTSLNMLTSKSNEKNPEADNHEEIRMRKLYSWKDNRDTEAEMETNFSY